MAGAGFKDFNSGDVLTASDVDTYLMQQTVMVFADSSARSTALGANVAEGMLSYLEDTDAVEKYDGSSWVAVGGGGGGSPLTTKGDLYGYSTTDARVPVGTDGQVLTADSAQSTGLSWSTPASGATKLINRNSFSNVASVTLDNVFTSTYKTYMVVIEEFRAATASDNLQMQFRYGATTQTSTYQGIAGNTAYNSNTVNGDQTGTTTEMTLSLDSGSVTYPHRAVLFFNGVGHTSELAHFHGSGVSGERATAYWYGGWNTTARTYHGLLFKSGSSNVTGIISVYGLVTA